MKSLAERHADRAQRKADNRAELTNTTAIDVGAAVVAARALADQLVNFPPEARDEFEAAMSGYDPNSSRSIAEDENGNSMAGIGVVNTKVVPAMAEGGNGGGTGGWIATPEPTDLGGSNANGAALDAQAPSGTSGAWGEGSGENEAASDKAATEATGKAKAK